MWCVLHYTDWRTDYVIKLSIIVIGWEKHNRNSCEFHTKQFYSSSNYSLLQNDLYIESAPQNKHWQLHVALRGSSVLSVFALSEELQKLLQSHFLFIDWSTI